MNIKLIKLINIASFSLPMIKKTVNIFIISVLVLSLLSTFLYADELGIAVEIPSQESIGAVQEETTTEAVDQDIREIPSGDMEVVTINDDNIAVDTKLQNENPADNEEIATDEQIPETENEITGDIIHENNEAAAQVVQISREGSSSGGSTSLPVETESNLDEQEVSENTNVRSQTQSKNIKRNIAVNLIVDVAGLDIINQYTEIFSLSESQIDISSSSDNNFVERAEPIEIIC